MNFLTQALSGMSGEPSTMRLLTAIIVCCVMFTWVYTSVVNQFLVPLTPEQMGLVLGSLGIKAWQRTKEASPVVPEPTTTKPNT